MHIGGLKYGASIEINKIHTEISTFWIYNFSISKGVSVIRYYNKPNMYSEGFVRFTYDNEIKRKQC